MQVAPYTGAWIEMTVGRGIHYRKPVAPYTGAWIEIISEGDTSLSYKSRSLHGSVD